MAIEFSCPSCKKQYRIKDDLGGRKAKCAGCQKIMKIPMPVSKEASEASQLEALVDEIASSSGVGLTATGSKATSTKAASTKATGSKATGSKTTGSKGLVAKSASAKSRSKKATNARKPEVEDEYGFANDDFGAPAGSAFQFDDNDPIPTPKAKCPSCDAPFSAGAVLCVVCGYNTKTGTKLAQSIEKPKKRRKKSGAGSMAFSFVRGTVFSLIGALLGALVWAGVAVATERVYVFIAWGVGALAGMGMAMGHEDNDGLLAGVVASGCSIVGVIAAKVFIVIFLIVPMLKPMADMNPAEIEEYNREELAAYMASEAFEEQGYEWTQDNSNEYSQKFEKQSQAAMQEIARLSAEEVQTRVDQYEEKLDAEFEASAPTRNREALAGRLANQRLQEQGIEWSESTADAFDVAYERQRKEAETEIASLTDDQVQSRIEELNAIVDAEFAANAPGAGQIAGGVMSLFFSSLFGPIDGIFMLLAAFTAFKLGSGEATD